MYTSNGTAYINYQQEMKDILHVELAIAEVRSGYPGKAHSIIQEFDEMMGTAAATLVGVPDRGQAVVDYVRYHYVGGQKPYWYQQMTGA